MEILSNAEIFWKTKHAWLESCGYQLRPRYQPDWFPSWIQDPPTDSILGVLKREDYLPTIAPQVMDAIRIKDGAAVIMKRVHRLDNEYNQEVEVSLFFSSPQLQKDPNNHCVPIYEMLEIPNDDTFAILVMPLLRRFNSPRFDTIGECMDFLLQIFKGLRFIHQHHIAHRDCTGPNVMMDGSELYPYGFHPTEQDYNLEFTCSAKQMYTRTQRPPTYYWIDFGNAACFDPSNRSPRIYPLHGTDKSAPEFQNLSQDSVEEFDPFPTDIYYLGNLVRMHFTEGDSDCGDPAIFGLEFLKPLIGDMVQDNPEKRPTIDQCVIRLEDLIRSQTSWALRAPVWQTDDSVLGIIYRLAPYWARRIIYTLTQTSPIPKRK
ncbi:hypothetical protein BDN70DRAFT_857084 [Pholiota conissans]|uniref:Protein kinase domain-containing protein n=1 Tax=Pholiota conissans TaxID=109636 RepID=A0A9P5Z367_9AGAR|nr:hypothetical protein BDN70DRAFT_857084 [Pholiota conissans]